MNIQEMVNSRIEELRSQSEAVTSSGRRPSQEQPAYSPESYPVMSVEEDAPGAYYEEPHPMPVRPRRDASASAGLQPVDLPRFGEVIDSVLAEVADRVLEITEQMAGDYARLEQDILASRLAVLRSVESVLDIALSLRREARAFIQEADRAQRYPRQRGAAVPTGLRRDDSFEPMPEFPGEGRTILQDRANMHDLGVASLFRRTL
jgi:hypothetical protein